VIPGGTVAAARPVSPANSGGRVLRWSVAACCAALFLAIKWNLWRNFGVHSEQAEFESRLWSTLHGGFLQATPGGPSFFGEHFSPILLAMLPFYALVPRPETLWCVEALVLAAAVLPLMSLARGMLPGHRAAALVAGLCWATSRPVNLGVSYDFHMEALYPLALFGALLSVERKQVAHLLAWSLLALTVKEDAAVVVASIGLLAAWKWRDARVLGLTAFAALWLWAAVGYVIPAFRGGAGYLFAARYADFGGDSGHIARNLVDPIRVARVVFQPAKVRVMFNTLGPFLFTPLLSPLVFVLLLVPAGLTLFASSFESMWALLNYYSLILMPLVFYAAFSGLRRLAGARLARAVPAVLALMLVAHIGNSRLYRQLDPQAWRREPRLTTAEAMIRAMPARGVVSAQANLVAHLPVTLERLELPRGMERADLLLFDTRGYTWPLSPEENRALLGRLRQDRSWKVAEERDGYVLLRRSAP
jgi:uncharacterized membrane protein